MYVLVSPLVHCRVVAHAAFTAAILDTVVGYVADICWDTAASIHCKNLSCAALQCPTSYVIMHLSASKQSLNMADLQARPYICMQPYVISMHNTVRTTDGCCDSLQRVLVV
jgi:hypothetical protein